MLGDPHLQAVADRIEAAYESGRTCRYTGRGFRDRVIRLDRLLGDGLIVRAVARRLADEAENVALAIAPLPVPPLGD